MEVAIYSWPLARTRTHRPLGQMSKEIRAGNKYSFPMEASISPHLFPQDKFAGCLVTCSKKTFFSSMGKLYMFNVHVWMLILIEYLRQVFDVYAECSVTDRCDRALALVPLWN